MKKSRRIVIMMRLGRKIGGVLFFLLAGQLLAVDIDKTGPYLGLAEPGIKAEVFAPGIVSLPGRYEYGVSIAPDGKTLLFTAEIPKQSSTIMMVEKNPKGWGSPHEVDFITDPKAGEFEGFFSRDGQSIFFAVSGEADCNIWQTRRSANNWSKPEKLGPAVNTGVVFYPIQAGDGSLYFTDLKKGQIMKAVWQEGKYLPASPIGLPFGVHAFLSPDDRFLLCDSAGDIFISERKTDGAWSTPIKLPESVNTKEFDETCPSLSPDGRFLFFGRYDEPGGLSNIYWVSTEVLSAPDAAAQKEAIIPPHR